MFEALPEGVIDISIHASREGSDPFPLTTISDVGYFYPRIP